MRDGYDAIVAMYHDQGLPVLKAASFGGGVNVTLGLPFIRTSVDHGTALDLAGMPLLPQPRIPAASSRRSSSRSRWPARAGRRARDEPCSCRRRRDAPGDGHQARAAAFRAELPRRCALRRAHRRGDRTRSRATRSSRSGRASPRSPARSSSARDTSPRSRSTATWPRAARRYRAGAADAARGRRARRSTSGRSATRPARRRQPAVQHQLADAVPSRALRRRACADVHVMLQKEVVDRMTAAPGTADYGRLTVMLQVRFEIAAPVRRAARRVPPRARRSTPRWRACVPLRGTRAGDRRFRRVRAARRRRVLAAPQDAAQRRCRRVRRRHAR